MNSPIKYPGGKSPLASKIVNLMPPRQTAAQKGYLHFVEPFFGGGNILFANDPIGISEVVNDIDGLLINFWRVLQDPIKFELLAERLNFTPFSEAEWIRAGWTVKKWRSGELDDNFDVEAAWAFFVFCRQSLAGRMDSFAPLSRTRVRRNMNEQASAWWTAIEGLPEVHERLKRVVILNKDGLEVIKKEDGPTTLFYVDCPYLPETRAAPDVYSFEMTREQHEQLLCLLCKCKGYVMLSGYDSELYNDSLSSWKKTVFNVPNHASGAKKKKVMGECLWLNYEPEVTNESKKAS